MISAYSSTLSALSAYGNQVAVVANNTANIHTENFEKSRAVMHSTHPTGVEAHVETIQTPEPMAIMSTPEGMSLVEQSNVDLAEEVTTLLIANRAYQANLSILKSEHERVGHLIDMAG